MTSKYDLALQEITKAIGFTIKYYNYHLKFNTVMIAGAGVTVLILILLFIGTYFVLCNNKYELELIFMRYGYSFILFHLVFLLIPSGILIYEVIKRNPIYDEYTKLKEFENTKQFEEILEKYNISKNLDVYNIKEIAEYGKLITIGKVYLEFDDENK